MDRINLKQLKEELNNIPDEVLDVMYIMHPYSIENFDEDRLKLIAFSDEYELIFSNNKFDVTHKFVEQINADANKIMLVRADPDKAEEYSEDIPN